MRIGNLECRKYNFNPKPGLYEVICWQGCDTSVRNLWWNVKTGRWDTISHSSDKLTCYVIGWLKPHGEDGYDIELDPSRCFEDHIDWDDLGRLLKISVTTLTSMEDTENE
jgi:hypothetical protein